MPYEIDYRPMKEYLPSRRMFLGAGSAAALGFFLSSRSRSESVHAHNIEQTELPIVLFNDAGHRISLVTLHTIVKPDSAWKQELDEDAFKVTRQGETERAFTGKYWNLQEKGVYSCVCCGTASFSSDHKFDSGKGWPSFWKPIARENVRETADTSLGMERVAVSCPRCDAHLGHVFEDGPQPTGRRYRVNSAALQFTKAA